MTIPFYPQSEPHDDSLPDDIEFDQYPEDDHPPEMLPVHGVSHIHHFRGQLVRVDIIEYADGHIGTTHKILEYTCWDGKFPF